MAKPAHILAVSDLDAAYSDYLDRYKLYMRSHKGAWNEKVFKEKLLSGKLVKIAHYAYQLQSCQS